MTRLKNISLFLFVLLVLHSCKKDEDVIEKAKIGGYVLNLCTDSAFANVTVNFITKKPEGNTSIQTISDANGNFLFNNISINHNSDYSYYFYIESYGIPTKKWTKNLSPYALTLQNDKNQNTLQPRI